MPQAGFWLITSLLAQSCHSPALEGELITNFSSTKICCAHYLPDHPTPDGVANSASCRNEGCRMDSVPEQMMLCCATETAATLAVGVLHTIIPLLGA